MTITSFEVHNDGVVTIHLTDMPRDAKIDNTTVYIGGTPQNEPEKVSTQQQMIRFTPTPLTQHHGVISVTVVREGGGQVTATSTETFTTGETTTGEGSLNPNVTGFRPAKVKAGDTITLRGTRMEMMDTVYLGFRMIPGKPRTTSQTASFLVPPGLTAGMYPIGYKGPNMGKKTTTFMVEIE